MSNRRDLLIALGAAAFFPRTLLAQSKQAPVVIGWLNAGSRKATAGRLAAFKEGMAELGWKEKASYVLEEHWADARPDRLDALARELAAKRATGADLVGAGLAASLARPGGMVTGVTNIGTEVSEKYLEFLLAATPHLKRVGFLADLTFPGRAEVMRAAQRSADRYSVDAKFEEARNPEQIENQAPSWSWRTR